ncbi:amino acid ABC transporter permease [Shinella daejeonensis]|uniref:amino acid ABC transporter permease n=1 Tax=Shinella daejeonensis TaxID=659017 RepID=UPI0020C7E232|nr:amino acid ABC transporter permease [Shinella daejeonensis]MCP8897467.1 amino acid ABC transporter permease [Shinella daejeonensis]
MSDILSFWGTYLPQILDGLGISLKVTGASLAIGIPAGLALALMVQAKSRFLRWFCLAVVEIGRGAPALILLQFAYFGLPNVGVSLTSFAAAVAALSWSTAAYTSEIIRAGLQAVPRGQIEASDALGLSFADQLRFVLVPQGLRVAAPALLGFAVLMLQASSLAFTIALPELLSQAYIIGTTTFRYMPILCLAGLLYACICIPATLLVGWFERRLARHA